METPRYVPHLAAAYDRGASRYRSDDEIEAQTPNHQRLGGKLRQLCAAFDQPVRVLEIGCGTGRFFHWLVNVKLLIGTDLSAEMLKRAEHPVFEERITAQEVRLVQGDVYRLDFPPDSFDLVYSVGMFGYGAVWTQELSDKVHGWLAPGGRLFFNAIQVPHSPNRMHRIKEAVKTNVYPVLPQKLERWLRSRETVPIVRHSRAPMERVLRASGFSEVQLESHRCNSPLWNGVHLECSARKTLATVRTTLRKGETDQPMTAAVAAAA